MSDPSRAIFTLLILGHMRWKRNRTENENRQRLMEKLLTNIRLWKYERQSKYAKMQIHKEIKRPEEIRKEQTIQDETHAILTIWILSRYRPHAEEKHRITEANYHKTNENQPTRMIQNDREKNAVTNGVKLADGAMGTADSIFDPMPQTPGEDTAQNTTAPPPHTNPTPRPDTATTPDDAIERAANQQKRRLRLHSSEIQREANNSPAQIQ